MAAGALVAEAVREWPLSEREGPGPKVGENQTEWARSDRFVTMWRIGDVCGDAAHLDDEVMQVSHMPTTLMAAEQGPLRGFPMLTRDFTIDNEPKMSFSGLVSAWRMFEYGEHEECKPDRTAYNVVTNIVLELEDSADVGEAIDSGGGDGVHLEIGHGVWREDDKTLLPFTCLDKGGRGRVWSLDAIIPMKAFDWRPMRFAIPSKQRVRRMWTRELGDNYFGGRVCTSLDMYMNSANKSDGGFDLDFSHTAFKITSRQRGRVRFCLELGAVRSVYAEERDDSEKWGRMHRTLRTHLYADERVGPCRFTDGWVNGILPGQTLEYCRRYLKCKKTKRESAEAPMWARLMDLTAAKKDFPDGDVPDDVAAEIWAGTSEKYSKMH